jgi:hypothetical protein
LVTIVATFSRLTCFDKYKFGSYYKNKYAK